MTDLKTMLERDLPSLDLDERTLDDRLRHVLRPRRRDRRIAATLASLAIAIGAVVWILAPPTATSPAREIDISLHGIPLETESDGNSVSVLSCTSGCSERATHSSGALTRVDAGSGQIVSAFQISEPVAFAISDHTPWTLNFRRGIVNRIDASTGRVTSTIKLSLPRPIMPGDSSFLPEAAAADDRAVWVASGRGWLARIDPRSRGRVTAMIPLTPLAPGQVIVGGGAAWVAMGPLGITRVGASATAGGTIKLHAGSRAVVSTDQLAFGDHSIWVYGELARRTPAGFVLTDRAQLVQMDARSGRVLARVRMPAGPIHVAYGDGMLWAADFLSGKIYRINPSRPKTFMQFAINGPGTLVAVTPGALWATTRQGTLRRIPVGRLTRSTVTSKP